MTLFGEPVLTKNVNDDVFTPDNIADYIVRHFKPKGIVLEPCRGKGAFTRALDPNTEWCEIEEGRDFFDYQKRVDWIVTNPPYSTFNDFLYHSFEIAENIVFLAPVYKLLKSWEVLMHIKEYGGIVEVIMIPARRCGFNFGFPCGAFHFKRGYSGLTRIGFWESQL